MYTFCFSESGFWAKRAESLFLSRQRVQMQKKKSNSFCICVPYSVFVWDVWKLGVLQTYFCNQKMYFSKTRIRKHFFFHYGLNCCFCSTVLDVVPLSAVLSCCLTAALPPRTLLGWIAKCMEVCVIPMDKFTFQMLLSISSVAVTHSPFCVLSSICLPACTSFLLLSYPLSHRL